MRCSPRIAGSDPPSTDKTPGAVKRHVHPHHDTAAVGDTFCRHGSTTETVAGTVAANGLEFAYLEAGPPDGPLALCLHGFPDSAHTWRYLLPELARPGYHAVAPFSRGYAPTDVPPDGLYQVGALARDANALHEVLGGGGDAVIIGHDWGALATYAAVAHRPERWRRAVTAAVAPTASVMASFFTYAQLRRSWYTFFFQSPLAELAVPMDDFVFIDRLWADWSPGYDAAFDLARVKESIGDPEHIAAAIGYYRALYDSAGTVPTWPTNRRPPCSRPLFRRCICTAETTGASGLKPSATRSRSWPRGRRWWWWTEPGTSSTSSNPTW